MKGFFHFILTLGFLVTFSVNQLVSAQDSVQELKTKFGIRAIGISLGWYNPSMDYWNSTYFAGITFSDPSGHIWENKFIGSFSYSAYVEFNIVNNLRLKASGTYWTEKVKSGSINVGTTKGTEQLTSSLTFLALDVIYRLGFLSFEKFSPYVGLGGSLVLVQNKFIRSSGDSDEEQFTNKGQDITGAITVGIDRKFGKHFIAAVDFRYQIGNYTQEMNDEYGNVIVDGSLTYEYQDATSGTGNTIIITQYDNFISDFASRGSSSKSVYVQRQAPLASPADALTVILAAEIPAETSVSVFYKTLQTNTEKSFDDIAYTGFNGDGTPDEALVYEKGVYKEYTYTAFNIPEFSSYVIKIVLKSSNSAIVPKIRDYRSIATSI